MKPTKIALSLLCFTVTAALSAAAAAADLPKAAELLPPDTAFMASIDDFTQLRAQVENTQLYKLYKDPEMARFVEDIKTRWRDRTSDATPLSSSKSDNDLLRTILDEKTWPQGRLTFAIILNEKTKDSDQLPFLLISQWGDAIDKIKESIDKTVQKDIAEGVQLQTEDYRGVTLFTTIEELEPREVPDWENYQPGQQEMPKKTIQPPPVKTSYCYVDDCLIAAVDVEFLRFVVAQMQGAGSASLAGDSDYVAAVGAVGPHHDIDVYVNIKQLIKTALLEDASGDAGNIITNLGFDNVAALACSAALARSPGTSWTAKAFLKINGSKTGICRMLDASSAAVTAPRFVPAAAYTFALFNIDIRKAYEELYNVLFKIDPGMAAKMHTPLLPATPDGQPGVLLKPDIIDHLGSQMIVSQTIEKPFIAGTEPTETLFAVGVSNRAALEKSLALIHEKLIAPTDPDSQRELLGHTIYFMRIPGLPFFGSGPTPMQPTGRLTAQTAEPNLAQVPTMAFTVTDTHLILGEEAAVEQAIRTLSSAEDTSITTADWWQKAKSYVPASVAMASFEDTVASAELFWWLLKQSASPTQGGAAVNPFAMMFGPAGLGQFADFSLLPEFDAVKKYFGLSVGYAVSRPDGFFAEGKYMNPEAPAD